MLNPFFRLLARTNAREVMSAAALFVVIGSANLMQSVGLSGVMGAFLAGLLLSESNFRHQIEADIEPFRGLLLGLFFMSIGLSLDSKVITENLYFIIIAVLSFILLKMILTFFMFRITKMSFVDSIRASILLSTIGEFAFVILPLSEKLGLIAKDHTSLYTSIAAISMFISPILVKLSDFLIHVFYNINNKENIEENFDNVVGEILVIGFGRFGQVVNQVLLAAEQNVTVIDTNIDRIRAASTFGFKVYYGDGRRLDVLRAAGADKVALIAVCVDDKDSASRIAEMVFRSFPHAKILVRAYDRNHAIDLMDRGVKNPVREMFDSALTFGKEALIGLGFSDDEARRIRQDVRRRDIQRLLRQREEGLFGGADLLHRATLVPQPLSPLKNKNLNISNVINSQEKSIIDGKEGVVDSSS